MYASIIYTELNDFRKVIRDNQKLLLKEFQFVMSLKIWRIIANTAPRRMTSLICFRYSYDLIFMAK